MPPHLQFAKINFALLAGALGSRARHILRAHKGWGAAGGLAAAAAAEAATQGQHTRAMLPAAAVCATHLGFIIAGAHGLHKVLRPDGRWPLRPPLTSLGHSSRCCAGMTDGTCECCQLSHTQG